MTIWAIILFAVAALGGVAMAAIHFRSKGQQHPPMPLALLHGLLAAIALVLLIIAFVQGGASGLGWAALIIFVVAALGGFVMFFRHLGKKPLPTPLVVIHGGAAVVAFVLLLIVAFA